MLKPVSHAYSHLRPDIRTSPQGMSSLPDLEQQQEVLEAFTTGSSPGQRPSAEALTFQQAFDQQLGLSEAMKAEKAGLMSESAHAFFRATPALFYHDLQGPFRDQAKLLPDPPPSLAILGDAHILNAGTFRGPDGKPVWGLNDFDQAETGTPDRDLQRLSTSLLIAADEAGLSASEGRALVRALGKSYLKNLDHKGPTFLRRSQTSGAVAKLLEKIENRPSDRVLKKYLAEDGRSMVRNNELYEPDPNRGPKVLQALTETFPDLKILDLASRPHSGGSTRGLERYFALVQDSNRTWVLETKAVLPSPVLIPDADLSRGDGEQVIDMTRKLGGVTDGRHRSFKLEGVAFFTREREAEKGSLSEDKEHLPELAEHLGKLLARAHCQGGPAVKDWIAGREETLLTNLVTFTQDYSQQVKNDHAAWSAVYPATESAEFPQDTPPAQLALPSQNDGFYFSR